MCDIIHYRKGLNIMKLKDLSEFLEPSLKIKVIEYHCLCEMDNKTLIKGYAIDCLRDNDMSERNVLNIRPESDILVIEVSMWQLMNG